MILSCCYNNNNKKIKPSSSSQIFNPVRERVDVTEQQTNLKFKGKKKKCLQGKENMNTCLLGVDDSGNQYEELSRNS